MVRDPNPAGQRGAEADWRPRGAREVPVASGRPSWAMPTAAAAGQRPLSDVLWEFAGPVLGDLDELSRDEVWERLSFAVTVWNAVLAEQHDADAGPLLVVRRLVEGIAGEDGAETLRQLEVLRRSKVERFGLDRRLVVEKWLERDGRTYRLSVQSADLAAM